MIYRQLFAETEACPHRFPGLGKRASDSELIELWDNSEASLLPSIKSRFCQNI